MAALVAELDRQAVLHGHSAENEERRRQLGSGERGDKRRTYRLQHDQVVDHVTGRTGRAAAILAGRFDDLWA